MTTKPERCDLCGCSIYLLSLMDGIGKGVPMKQFMMAGLKRPVWACELCQPRLELAVITKDWKLLPEGPLRKEFEKEAERREVQTDNEGGPT